MSFAWDLIRRSLLLFGVVLLSIPLWSLGSHAGGSVGALTASQAVECAAIVFISVGSTWSILSGRIFFESRLARPAFALAVVVTASGLVALSGQFSEVSESLDGVWRALTGYFADSEAAALLQPTLHALEIAVLAPLVELAIPRRARRPRAALAALLTIGFAGVFARSSLLELVSATLATPELVLAGLASIVWLLSEAFGAVAVSVRRFLLPVVTAVVVISVPLRIAASWADPVEVSGAGPVQPPMEGESYRIAERRSTWRLREDARIFVAPMRWDRSGAEDCGVRIFVRNRPDDEVGLRADRWAPVRLSIPPPAPGERPEVTLEVSNSSCRLLVGPVTVTR